MVDLELFLYANPDENNEISEFITENILDNYIREHHLNFDPNNFKNEREYIKAAEKLVGDLKTFIRTTDYSDLLIRKGIEDVELVVERINGPVVESWYIWDNSKKVDLPEEDEIGRPGSIDSDKQFENFIRDYLECEYGSEVESFTYEFDMRRIYIHNIVWKED